VIFIERKIATRTQSSALEAVQTRLVSFQGVLNVGIPRRFGNAIINKVLRSSAESIQGYLIANTSSRETESDILTSLSIQCFQEWQR
jgi:hypothetical protein